MEFDEHFWNGIDRLVDESRLVIDRPSGSAHPRYPETIYPLDYGYLDGTAASDGDGVDVWVGTSGDSICDAVICSIDLEKRDTELKLLIGCTPAEQQTVLAFHNHYEQHAVLVQRAAPSAPPPEPASVRYSVLLFVLTLIALAVFIVLPRDIAKVGFAGLVLGSLALVYGPRLTRTRGEWRNNARRWGSTTWDWVTQRHTSLSVALFGVAGLGLILGAGFLVAVPDREALKTGVAEHNGAFFALNDGRLVQGMAEHLRAVDWIWNTEIQTAMILVLVGWLFLAMASVLLKDKPASLVLADGKLASAPLRWWAIIAGILALALLTLANTNVFGTGVRGEIPTDLQFAFLVVGIVLLAWGVSGASWHPSRPVVAWQTWLPLGAVTLAAFVLRVWNLEYSVHRFVDEIHFVNAINTLQADSNTPILERFSDVASFPYLYPYFQSKTVALLGHNFAGFRMASALLGTLTVPALYFLARTLFNRRVALLSAAALACLPIHIHFSRIGLNNIADPLVAVLAMAFLGRALASNRRADYAWGGAMLGLTQYFYEGGRLLYPPVIVVWLLAVAVIARGKVSWRGLGVAAVVAVLVAVPVYIAVADVDQRATPRMDEMGLGRDYFTTVLLTDIEQLWKPHLWHIAAAFLTLFYLPDVSWFYGDEYPFLMPLLVPAFLAGLVIAIWRWLKPGPMLLLTWLGVTILGQSLLVDSTLAPRFVVVLPLLALFVGFGVASLLDFLEPLHTRQNWPRAIMHGAVVVLVVVVGVVQVTHYFGPFMEEYNVRIRIGPDPEDALLRSLEFPAGTEVTIVGSTILWPINMNTILEYFDADLKVHLLFPNEMSYEFLGTLSPDVDHAFFVEPWDDRAIEIIYSYFDFEAPRGSPYDIPDEKEYILLYNRVPQRDG